MLLRRDLTFTAAVLVLAAYPLGVRAHDPHVCPPDLPDTPAFTGHIEQDDIVAGAFRLSELFDIGQELFVAVFNVCDGQGRPASTGTGAAGSSEYLTGTTTMRRHRAVEKRGPLARVATLLIETDEDFAVVETA